MARRLAICFTTLLATAVLIACGESSDPQADSDAEAEVVEEINRVCREHRGAVNDSIDELRRSRTVDATWTRAEIVAQDLGSLIREIDEVPIPESQELDIHRLSEALEDVRSSFRDLANTMESALFAKSPREQRIFLLVGEGEVQRMSKETDKATATVTEVGFTDCGFR